MIRTMLDSPKDPTPLYYEFPAGRKLTICMLEGTASGPMTIEIGNWSGSAIFCPRASLKSLIQRKELSTPGVYLLLSQSNRAEFDGSIYVGEAEMPAARIRQHMADRDFESVVCFSSKELTRAHIKYLEARLVELARDANTSYVENGNIPRGAHLSDADVSMMEYFIGQIKLILRVVGIRALMTVAPNSGIPAAKSLTPRWRNLQQKSDNAASYVEMADTKPQCLSEAPKLPPFPLQAPFSTESSQTITKDLKRILRATAYSITDRNVFAEAPCSEEEVHHRIDAVLRCIFPDLLRRPRINKQIKHFEADTGLPCIQTLIEYKFVNDEDDCKRVADEILADTRGYISPDWKVLIFVIYETRPLRSEVQWGQMLRACGVATERSSVIVLTGGGPIGSGQGERRRQ